VIKKRKLVIDATSSVAQIVVGGVALFFLYKFLLAVLGPANLGVWSLVVATSSLVQVANFGLASSVIKQVAEYDAAKDSEKLGLAIQTAAVSMAVLCIPVVALAYPLARQYLIFALKGNQYRAAIDIMPVALGAFWVMMVGGIYQGALYGCQLIISRNGILIAETVLYFLLCLLFAPTYGLVGLVWARLLQNCVTLALSALILKHHVPAMPLIPHRWDKALFKEVFAYASNFQIISLLVLMCDPLTKGLLSRYGSISDVAYYEMASKMIQQFRALILNANQVLVPVFVRLGKLDPARMQLVYNVSYQVIFFLSIVTYGFVAAAAPLLSEFWLGHFEPAFVWPMLLLCVGWCANSIGIPAYHASLGSGKLKFNVIAHGLMAITNALIACVLGPMIGGIGVVAAWSFALCLSSAVLCWSQQHVSSRPLTELLPPGGMRLIIVCTGALCAGYWLYLYASPAAEQRHAMASSGLLTNVSARGLIAVGIYAALMSLVTWEHPVRRQLTSWLFSLRHGDIMVDDQPRC
jgi:O-antigen/teichoic acid export membrane protein